MGGGSRGYGWWLGLFGHLRTDQNQITVHAIIWVVRIGSPSGVGGRYVGALWFCFVRFVAFVANGAGTTTHVAMLGERNGTFEVRSQIGGQFSE